MKMSKEEYSEIFDKTFGRLVEEGLIEVVDLSHEIDYDDMTDDEIWELLKAGKL